MWTKESLKRIIKENFAGYKFILASNREPFLHIYDEGKKQKIICKRSVGGVSVALDSVMRATQGTWIAYGGSAADKEVVDKLDHIQVPTNNPKYTLRRVWMTESERRGYYEGFSNETLWPICHAVFMRPTFKESDWLAYKKINKRFANAILEEIKDKKAIVWIQDFQLSLVTEYIKDKRPDVLIGQFWHIPWPTYEIFRTCPWKKEILNGLLANDLLGFHRFYHVDNFLNNVDREMESNINKEDLMVNYKNHKTKVGFFPISVDYEKIVNYVKNTKNNKKMIEKYVKSPYKYLAIGIDRIDYTKGIVNRLLAIEKFLEMYPSYKGKFVYFGIGSPSRSGISTYRKLSKEIRRQVLRINNKFAQKNWQPIYYLEEIMDRQDLLKICQKADLCLVTSLDDGMNLVSKEYVVANKGDGALILSSFTGAAKELTDAFLINPYDIKETAESIKKAIETPRKEKIKRMTNMKKIIKNRNIFRWASKFLLELSKLK